MTSAEQIVDPTAHDSGNKATDKFKANRVSSDTSRNAQTRST